MARWVGTFLALLCVGCVAAEVDDLGSWMRSRSHSHSGREPRPSRYRSRLWRAHRPSVPETPRPTTQTDRMEQLQQLLHQIVNGTQSDQPRQPFVLAQRVGPRKGLSRLSTARTFNNFSVMSDASPGFEEGAATEVINLVTMISMNYSCSEPVRQLVSVSEVHPAVSATYLPASVPLRRCSDQTGCCSDSETCGPAANTTTKLPVIVNHVVGNVRNELKYLSFVEHTACKCTPKMRSPMRTPECPQSSPANGERNTIKFRAGKKHNKQKGSKRDKKSAQQTCNCTSEFASRQLPNGRCKCDCFVSNRKCKRQQRGRFLSEADNRCIRRGDCKPPVCRHGKYRASYGRCPQRKGEFRKRRFIV